MTSMSSTIMCLALTEDVPKVVIDRGGKKEYVRSQFLGKDMVQRRKKLTASEARIIFKQLFLLNCIAKLYTRNYRVPEMLPRKGHRCEVDIWSIGCILRLQSELEETTARMQAEGNAIKATIVQLEEAKATFVAEVSQLQLKQLRQECGSLKLNLAYMSEKLLCREQNVGSQKSGQDGITGPMPSGLLTPHDGRASIRHSQCHSDFQQT
ncbi:hypothetical protein HPB49_009717 [Dermacentor silvarum]|uniref:Uncharacterized protein n=1 Tax=Dermacentor silvarum TaxID=543639 RepID=A0ACB8DZ31_DERSI|nr:hypothetical protein HPB49_009717 [Dermacentor silvarum]